MAPMRLMPSRTPISDVGSEAGEGVRLRISRSVSQARCLPKGASGQAPRGVVVVVLVGGNGVVAFCGGRSTSGDDRGMERVKEVVINAKRGRLCESIADGW